MVLRAVNDRSQLRLGGVRISGPLINVKPAMAATVLVEEAREEAAPQAKFGRRVLLVSFCQVPSGVVTSKGYPGRRVGAKRHYCCPRLMSEVFALEIARK